MRPDPVVEFTLGLGAILAAIAVALLLAFPPSWLDSRQAAVADFRNVSHLGEGSSISENGYVWGTVTGIDAVDGHYRVRLKVRPGFQLAADQGLALDETNPVQAASLVVARRCALTPGAQIAAGCCPERITAAARPASGERGIASCGHIPSLVDTALATVLQTKATVTLATKQIADLSDALRKTLPDLQAKTNTALTATASGMVAMKSVSDIAKGVLTDNGEHLKGTLANADATLSNLKVTTQNVKDLMAAKKDQLDASIGNVSSVLATTAATMPALVDNLQKSLEDLRAITGQIRSEPTSIVRRRERSDPSFVDPAAEK